MHHPCGHEALCVVEPVLVAQVKFTEWTLDDQLRQAVFLGLRTDKDPKDNAVSRIERLCVKVLTIVHKIFYTTWDLRCRKVSCIRLAG
jgi:hypothetical protein